MLVKTDKVQEKGVSIGMFSRQGIATGTLNSHFRDKDFKSPSKATDSPENIKKDSIEFNDEAIKEQHRGQFTQSYFFRSISREKDPRRPVRSGADGIYKPNFDAVHTKPISLPLNQTSPTKKGSGSDIESRVCDFKIRDIKRKIATKFKELSFYKLDLQSLFNQKLIEKEVYARLMDPELGIVMNKPITSSKNSSYRSRNAMADEEELRKQQGYVGEAYSKVKELDSLRAQLKTIIAKNVEKLRQKEDEIVEKPQKHVGSPLPLKQQLKRPPLINPNRSYDHEDLNINKSTIEINAHRAHKFSSYVERNLWGNLEDKPSPSYNVSIETFYLTRPRTKNGAMVELGKQKRRDHILGKHYVLSTSDYTDLNETSLSVSPHKKDRSLVNMDRTAGRANHFIPRLGITPKEQSSPQDTINSFSFYSFGNKLLNTSLRAAMRSASARSDQVARTYASNFILEL